MKVVDHEPSCWFLLASEEGLLLEVNCNHTVFGYSWIIKLLDHEVQGYHREGKSYLTVLANQVQNSAPIAKDSFSPFKDRMVNKMDQQAVHEAILSWKSEHSA